MALAGRRTLPGVRGARDGAALPELAAGHHCPAGLLVDEDTVHWPTASRPEPDRRHVPGALPALARPGRACSRPTTPRELDGAVPLGGAAALSADWQRDRQADPNTLTFTAGDAFGASPPLSAFFQDEPAVLAMNLMGIDADPFGNHNFDKGLAYLQNLLAKAAFRHGTSNLRNLEANLSGADRLATFDVGGTRVSVVGIPPGGQEPGLPRPLRHHRHRAAGLRGQAGQGAAPPGRRQGHRMAQATGVVAPGPGPAPIPGSRLTAARLAASRPGAWWPAGRDRACCRSYSRVAAGRAPASPGFPP